MTRKWLSHMPRLSRRRTESKRQQQNPVDTTLFGYDCQILKVVNSLALMYTFRCVARLVYRTKLRLIFDLNSPTNSLLYP